MALSDIVSGLHEVLPDLPFTLESHQLLETRAGIGTDAGSNPPSAEIGHFSRRSFWIFNCVVACCSILARFVQIDATVSICL